MNWIIVAVAATVLLVNIWAFTAISFWFRYDRFVTPFVKYLELQTSNKTGIAFGKISASFLYAVIVLAMVAVVDTALLTIVLFFAHP